MDFNFFNLFYYLKFTSFLLSDRFKVLVVAIPTCFFVILCVLRPRLSFRVLSVFSYMFVFGGGGAPLMKCRLALKWAIYFYDFLSPRRSTDFDEICLGQLFAVSLFFIYAHFT